MLVLGLKKGDAVAIGPKIMVKVERIGEQVKLMFAAPEDVEIVRCGKLHTSLVEEVQHGRNALDVAAAARDWRSRLRDGVADPGQ